MALQIRGVHHIVLTVSDPNKSAEFYEKILGLKASRENPQVRWISCGNFLLCFQRPSKQAIPNDRFDENRLGLDHVGFAVESHQQLNDLIAVLGELGVTTAGIEFDPDGQSDYVCFRDPDNIQVEIYVGDYHN
jgi:glyoxylase I family protein